MLKKILTQGIRLKKRMLWVIAIILLITTAAVASTAEPIRTIAANTWGFGVPFLKSWLPIWIFAFAGGVGSLFFKIEQIDKHFRYLLVAKPFLGVFGALSLCLILASAVEPQPPIMSAYAFIAALLSAPILQGLLAAASISRNHAAFINAVNPFKFKVVVDDKGDRDDNTKS
ncbi:hypothetical protein MN210_10890 [Psychrobacter raelei]|uniref:Uncharacterized protein n=1 Tax=Psychrobacter raelei TaxID=2565531 RepID=A0AAT9PEA7_9GAMM|nr:hypothetical protein [Psychrobacter sp. PraFG1]UNK04709.1 hypothetical protein MN210_10890 [Psychrobacter sp. PraFG1]